MSKTLTIIKPKDKLISDIPRYSYIYVEGKGVLMYLYNMENGKVKVLPMFGDEKEIPNNSVFTLVNITVTLEYIS